MDNISKSEFYRNLMQQSVEQNLSKQELLRLRNNRTGLFLFQLSWILVFVTLVNVNLMIRGNFESWPPPGVERLGIALPILATIALVVSSVFAHRGSDALKADQPDTLRSRWRVTLGLGVFFVLVMAFEWLTVPVTGQYSTIFRVMTAFHGIHALVIGLFVWRVYRAAHTYNSQNFWMVEAATSMWDFVTIAWALFFVVLYII